MNDPVTAYAEKVAKGKILACRTHRWACERHLRDIRRKDLEWRPEEVEDLQSFYGLLKFWKGDKAGERIELSPWQVFALGVPLAYYYHDGRRRFQEAYLEVPRGAGKTTMVAPMPLYGMSLDGESGAQCFALATKEKQARLVWTDAKKFIKHSPELQEMFRCLVGEILCEDTDGSFKPMGADSDTLDGLDVHFGICDEIHAWRSGELYRVVRDGMIKRNRSLMMMITTAGFNLQGFGASVHESAKMILDPDEPTWDNDRFFADIFTVDDVEKWEEPQQWSMANPGMGVSISEKDFRHKYDTRNQAPNTENNFKVKHLNIWGSGDDGWFPVGTWKECADPDLCRVEDLRDRDCVAGFDFAEVHDLSAFVRYFLPRFPGDHGVFIPTFWVPGEDVEEREKKDQVPYAEWAKRGLIRVMDGNTTDKTVIIRDIVEIAREHPIRTIGIDPYRFRREAQELQDKHGLVVGEIIQGWKTMDPATKELKRLTMGRHIVHPGHPVLDWNIKNLVVKTGANGNVQPDKGKSADRIDGAVAAIIAIATDLATKEEKPSVYEERGIRTL